MIRIIPKLDIKGPNVVKGLCYDGYRVVGKPDVLAQYYYQQGADELFFQDVVASLYERNNLLEIVSLTAGNVMIPITVSGGIRSIEDIKQTLKAGADKVALNTEAIKNPKILEDSAKQFGSQCIVLSIEAKRIKTGFYEAWFDYGREPSGLELKEWVKKAENYGIGEIYLSSVDRDGTGLGYDIELINEISSYSTVPIIASSGAGKYIDFYEVISNTNINAVSAASVFHYNYNDKKVSDRNSLSNLRMGKQIDIGNIEFLSEGYGSFNNIQVEKCSIIDLKKYLKEKQIEVRI